MIALTFSALSLLLSNPDGAETALTHRPTSFITASPPDSIGIERRDGKYFVIHRVTQGQTLYAVARRYNTSVEAIKAANPGMNDGLQYNQTLRVPQPEPELSRKDERAAERAARREEKAARKAEKADDDDQLMKPDAPKALSTKSADIHVVEAGQTLYSLAVKYNILMTDLRRWNNLTNDNILVGQALIVSEKGFQARQAGNEPTAVASAKPEPKAEAPRKEAPKVEPKPEIKAETKPEPKSETKSEPKSETSSESSSRPDFLRSRRAERAAERTNTSEERPPKPGDPGTRMATKGRRLSEIGMAEQIEAEGSSNKYLALHRSAPVGSLVQVRNDITNQSLWVKVIGRLPDTGVNERVLIKLSSKAFEKLSPNNQGFRAEVSYIVP